MLLTIKAKHLIHLQSPWNLMRNKQHRHRPLELVDRPRELFRRLTEGVRDISNFRFPSLPISIPSKSKILLARHRWRQIRRFASRIRSSPLAGVVPYPQLSADRFGKALVPDRHTQLQRLPYIAGSLCI